MGVSIEVNPRELLGTMQVLESQLPYATMKALNEVATGFEGEEQAVVRSSMTIRRPWVVQGIKMNRSDFATKQSLRAIVRIDPSRDFLEKFEPGGVRVPQGANRSLAVPVNVRRTKTQIIQKTQRPKAFNFHQGFSSTTSRWTIYKGDRGTFLLQRPDGSGIILQRTKKAHLGPSLYGNRNTVHGRGYGHDPSVVILWALRPTTPVPQLLHFYDHAQKSVLSLWKGSFEKWYLEALRTAR
jgi:hypothetical protein